ncbi:MAG: alanine racemase [Pseudomonadota bacterium]
MTTGSLTISPEAIIANYRALDALSAPTVETSGVVKADGYGLGLAPVAKALASAGAKTFFVAQAQEGAALRRIMGSGFRIFVFEGHMAEATEAIETADLIPALNSIEQLTCHFERLPGHPFAIQLDTGMNRLGFEPGAWVAVRDAALHAGPELIMSHLSCADDPDHPMNPFQRDVFLQMAEGANTPLSLAATGGTLLGADYHFNMVRPGIGLYGGMPFAKAKPVVNLQLPTIQTRELVPGEAVGYGNTWTAPGTALIATVSGGYADGLLRTLSGSKARLYAKGVACPIVGRVSMDLLTVDVTHLEEVPDYFEVLGPNQSIDDLAAEAGTIGYEILTSLGGRYTRAGI